MHCPVCMMETDDSHISYMYADMQFTFCSQQCKERFTANPNLYVNQAGKTAVKHYIKNITKLRTLELEEIIPDDIANAISQSLMTMMGINKVQVKGKKITITYNLLEATTEQIEEHIEQMGQSLSRNWIDRLKRAFIHYSEETELDNLEQGDGYSCHNPPK